jgi:RNA polymerase sigma factor (sigma-70 family)
LTPVRNTAGAAHPTTMSVAHELSRPRPPQSEAARRWLEDLLAEAAPGADDERRLVIAAQRGDERARERLVRAFMPRIAAVARHYRADPVVEREELLQEGVGGLLAALDRYDPDRGTPFWAFAEPYVMRSMRGLVRELTRSVSMSDRGLRRLGRLRAAERELTAELKREPTPKELAERSGLPLENVEELLRADSAPVSTNEPISDRGMPVGKLEDRIADPRGEEAYEQLLDEIEGEEFRALLSRLSPREREILKARYVEEQSRKEVAERLGLDVERVEQIERRALRKLEAAARRAGFAE